MFSRSRFASLVSGIARVAALFGLLLLASPGFSQGLSGDGRLSISLNGAPIVRSGASSSTIQLSANVLPPDATNKEVQWSSNNPSVASVDSSGNVTAVSVGTAIITVTSLDGSFTAQCVVTVNSAGLPVKSVLPCASVGGDFMLFIKADGTLWACGLNTNGQLGLGHTNTVNVPTQIGTDTDWAAIAAGTYHSLALKNDGSLWVWGNTASGALGATVANNKIPSRILADSRWVDIAAGNSHSVALKDDGTVWAWGLCDYLQSPDNTGVPKKYSSNLNSDFVSVTAGDRLTFAVKSSGQVYSAGYNAFAQTGKNVASTQESFGMASPLSTVASIAAGSGHGIAIFANGSLWAWGTSMAGSAGLGSSTNVKIPLQIGTSTDWVQVVSGDYFSVALNSSGKIFSTGNNTYGALGSGNTTARTTFAQIGLDSDWTFVAAGGYSTCAIKADGSFYTWGQNSSGQLGIGSTGSYSTLPCKITF
ncbi:MAG: Ig-like domain-containing protein [Holophagales bacterium]|jgi:alpha-tubulin suppressor-like RCC1 family protein|nr:Ig-like domain-containing protein [Holophagales bacterium]